MKITICGSLAFMDEMEKTKQHLERLGHEVKMPPGLLDDGRGGQISAADRYRAIKEARPSDAWVWNLKEAAMRLHFDKVAWADAVVIINEEKNGIAGYVGANTLLEMGLAFYLHKPIYLIHPVPEISYRDEILGMKPIVVGQDFSNMKTVR